MRISDWSSDVCSSDLQVAARLQRAVDAQQDVFFHFGREVDQHVAAEHDVELAQAGVAVQQVERAELHSALDRRLDHPAPRSFGVEVALQAIRRQAAPDSQAVVFAGLAVIEHGSGPLGSYDFHDHFNLADFGPLELND